LKAPTYLFPPLLVLLKLKLRRGLKAKVEEPIGIRENILNSEED